MNAESNVSLKSRITLSFVVVSVPLFVWAGRLDNRVERLEQERSEMRHELREISRKLDDVRERIPLVRPKL